MPRAAKTAKSRQRAASEAGVDAAFAPVVEAFRGDRSVTSGWMMASFGLKVNGRIFAMYPKGKFVAKLPKSRVDALVGERVGKPFDPGHGRLMKEWIELSGHRAMWVELAKEAYRFVKSG
jgi:hypothetical protein